MKKFKLHFNSMLEEFEAESREDAWKMVDKWIANDIELLEMNDDKSIRGEN